LRFHPFEALSLRLDPFETCLLLLDPFKTCPLRFDPFEALSLRFDPFETCLLRFDPFGALSLRLDLFGDVSFAVRSVWRRVFCGSIHLEMCLFRFNHAGASPLRFDPFEASSLRFVRRLCGLILPICRLETSPLWFGDLADLMSLRFAWHYGLILQICHPETSPLQFNLVDSISLWCNYDLHFELPLWRHVLFLPQSLLLCVSPFSVTIMNFCVTPFFAIMIFCIISTDVRGMHCFRVCVRIECSSQEKL
jgi:hypothetical protein